MEKKYGKNKFTKFPPKLLNGNLKEENIEKRKKLLEIFLQNCLIDFKVFYILKKKKGFQYNS
jgi:hypothetical protein